MGNIDIDSFEEGQLINIEFKSVNGFGSAVLPALIFRKRRTADDWPIYDVYFWTKTNHFETSGALELKGVMIWRYLSSNQKPFEIMFNSKDYSLDIPFKKLFYIENGKKIYLYKKEIYGQR